MTLKDEVQRKLILALISAAPLRGTFEELRETWKALEALRAEVLKAETLA